MIEKIIKGINYRLNEETLTAEVIKQENGYEGDIIIPETVELKVAYRVTSIGERAFCQCEYLTSIAIPDSVTNIGQEAFEDCFSLEAIVIPNSVTSIGDRAFKGCIPLTSVVIPDSVTSIGEEVFCCTDLESIVIPESVTSIGECAFRDCSFLTSIRFNGTKAQWKGIKLGAGWNESLPTTVVHCTDGKVKM